ncbi:reticulon-1a isoform X1 [Anguilla anguilla]|uniref:reticulon-1a isoform X1 n=1 Tax=Anguilla anguilla TaxID=7936 RepID=UPI0015AC711B|nr:reticulon-1a isoform X1 [Anguilla anguilla]
MSVKPSEEQGSEGRWFGEDFEKLDRFGSTVPRFDERGDEFQPENWEDESPEQKQCLYEPESNRQRPSVAMETASTGGNASLFDSLSSKGDSDLDLLMKSTDNDGDLYTSLLSSQNYSFQQDTSYFSGDMGGEAQKFPPPPARDRVPSPESHGAFNSDSGIEMTPGESIDVAKNLLESEKMEAYNYMDMSRGEEARPRQPETGPAGPGPYLEKSPPVETLGPALDSHAFPYVEDPSDEEPSDYQSYRALGTPQTASPIKITLTETPAAPASEARPQVSERESILSLGLEGVPTVTLSEPEDDSPGSVTPPLEEDFPDPLFQAREVKLVGSASDRAFSSALPSSGSLRQPGPQGKAKRASKPRPSQEDGSSAESGDSEIELVSEEPPSRPPPPGAGYASFGPAPAPPPAPSVQYSILREEREAELDSELIIESCDASSASEESPKREQDSPAPKGRGADAPLAYSFTAAPAPAPSPAPIPASVPAPVVPPASAARETQASDRSQSSVGTGDAPAAKPKPPAAVVPPEVRVEQPPPEEEPGWRTRRASEGKRELEGGAAAPAFLQGFSKQKAMDLLYWRDVKQTGVLFGSVLLLLFSLTQFSVVSVAAYLALAALSATISFRIYKSVLQAVQKTDEGHPFKSYLDMEISLSHDQIQKYADSAQLYANTTLKELRRLFLVQDLVDSLKFAVLMWLLTYVGALFNGLTLLILAVVSMFTMPVVYEKYQAQIDQYLGLIRTHVNSVVGKIQAKIPGAKRKAE